MSQHRNRPGLWTRGGRYALAVLAALLLAIPAAALEPPEQPGPPLFEPEFHTNPVHMTVAVVGASAAPHTARWSAAAVLFAGEHPRVKAWNLQNSLTNRYSRIGIGAGSLVLNGFGSGLSRALTELATLGAGQYLECWQLRDTDRLILWRPEWNQVVHDGKGVGSTGTVEAGVYSEVLIRAHYTSNKGFRRHVRRDVTFTHLFEDPDKYRGAIVRAEGRLLRVNRYDPPFEAREASVFNLYEAWIFPEQFGSHPFCVLFTEWPADLPRSLLGQQKIQTPLTVRLDGYFFKKLRYSANGRGGEREAPLVIGHGLSVVSAAAEEPPVTHSWVNNLVYVFLGLVAALLFGVIGLTYWFRKTDNDIHKRLLRARSPEFILPPPDALPAVPLAPPVERARLPVPPRINLPPGPVDRPADPPPGRRGTGGPREEPPDEDAGA
jgi:hypothetical protein